jgi:microcin C transport system permease protein
MSASSPASRRWKRFRAHKRGYWSLILFAWVFAFSLASDFLCNDRPLVISYQGRFLFPLWNYYPETRFGGTLDLETDYSGPEFGKALDQAKGWALWPPIRYNPSSVNLDLPSPAPTPPSMQNILGTDDQGRDVFTRLLYGLRTSLVFGLSLALISSMVGIFAGAVQGYFGGWIDLLFQRSMEIWAGLPLLFILMILSSLIQPTFIWLLGMMALFGWMEPVALVRAEFLRARQHLYVKSAKVLGLHPFWIVVRHILPNAMTSVLSFFPFLVSHSIATLTALDFLGFGLPPGTASLGELLQQAKTNLFSPWLGLTSFFSIALILVLITFIGEGLRDAYDPRTS